MMEPITYRVAEGGPFNLEVDNGVTIENITDDLVNAKILVPDTRLQDIADAYRDYIEDDGTLGGEAVIKHEIFMDKVRALTQEDNDGS